MEDFRIIELYFQRSEQAIDETERKYGRLCRSIARKLLHSEEDVRECANDTLFGVWKSIPPARPENLSAYIARIARNTAMKRLTRENAAKRSAVVLSFEELNECIPAAVSPEQMLEGKELARVLERFLYTLDRENRDLFLRRYWFFDSVAQMAAGFGMSQSNVKSRLHRIREKLKQYLEEEADIRVR